MSPRRTFAILFFGCIAASAGCSKSEKAASATADTAKATSAAARSGTRVASQGEACPPGAKCDGYCAADQMQVADGVSCAKCISSECDAPFDKGCAGAPDPGACEAIVQCFYRTNCLAGGVVPCYCGDASVDTCTSKGPSGGKCTDVIAAGLPKGTSAGEIIKAFGNAATAGGVATGMGLCIGHFCSKQCVPFCGSRS